MARGTEWGGGPRVATRMRRGGVRWLVTTIAAATMFAPSAIVISQEGLLNAKAATTPLVNDQSPEDPATGEPTENGPADQSPDRTSASKPPQATSPGGSSPEGAAALPPDVLWEGNPHLGTRAFDGLERLPGTITVADDPQGRFGRSFRYETWDNADGDKERCESKGLRQPDGSVLRLGSAEEGRTFYLGWRALWGPMPNVRGRWLALFQLHVSGVDSGGLNVGPFVLRTFGDGRLYFQHISPNGTDRHIWSTSMPLNRWSSFVIGFTLSRNDSVGSVEFWYNGVQQRFVNGSTRYRGATLWGTHVNAKWGVYRSGGNSGHAVAYLNHARLGMTYASVAP